MGRAGVIRVGVIAVMLAALSGACGGNDRSSVRTAGGAPVLPTTSTSSTTVVAEPPSTTATSSPPARPPERAVADPPSNAPDPAPQAAPSASRGVIDEVGDTGGATKVITVVSSSWSSSTASLALWERQGDGWAQVGGPWEANVGGGGWAYEPGEETRRSPVGSFGFGGGFGTQANPGYTGGWFVIGDTDYWVEDPASPDYNTHQNGPADPALAPWGHFEHLADFPVAYRYVTMIDFNVPPRGGIGSGIFLHVSTGGSTAGCVSLPEDALLTTLRWIDPGSTRIVMGPESELSKL